MKTYAFPSAILALLLSTAVGATSLFVRPTTVILSGGQSAAAVTVTNSGDTPVTAQLRVFTWDQNENEDKLDPTTALAASPPMMTIPAGQSQTIRLVRTEKTPAKREESYRLLVDEIVDRAAVTGTGVAIQLRYSVPVFVMPRSDAAAKLSFKAAVDNGTLVIDAVNRGQSHAQIANVSLKYADGSSQLVGSGLVGYVLPDRNRQWKLQLPPGVAATAQGQPQRVRAMVNGQELLVAL
ncbi:MAG TPA: molecular chaperone [Povalibacter sp.]|nr:molecular chaperone [Povalibacter sp.]